LPNEHRVKQPQRGAVPSPSEFPAAIADPFPMLSRSSVETGRTNPCRIGLGDSEHITDRLRAEARARGHSRDRVRRGHKGVGAVIDIEQAPWRLRRGCACRRAGRCRAAPGRVHVGENFRRDTIELGANGLCGDRFESKTPAQRLVMASSRAIF